MANKEQLAILKQGVEVWNKWREENPEEVIDLTGARLSNANLSKANLRWANLFKAKLSGAKLGGANLFKANLSEAKLSGSKLGGANLFKANLSKANLGGAKLSRASLSEANLSEANLSKANLFKVDLSNANLTEANLRKTNLSKANLSRANLSEADLSGADLGKADLKEAILSDANLSRADLSGASLVETNLMDATLTGCKIYGISAWNLELEGAEQSNLVITREYEPTIMVDNLEVAQFIYLLLNREKLRDVLNTMTKKGVLILGRFDDGGLKVLQAIAGMIRERGYLPMLFDFDKCDSLNFTQTVKVMVGLSRFVIADLSGPSVLKELEATVPFHNVPFIPIIEKGRGYPSMGVDLTIYPWFHWPPVPFANKEKLVERLQEDVIDPAEKIGKPRQEGRALLFSE